MYVRLYVWPVCMYVCMYVLGVHDMHVMYLFVRVCVCMRARVRARTYVWHACIFSCVRAYVHIGPEYIDFMFVCMHVLVYSWSICMYVCICMCMYILVRLEIIFLYVFMYVCMYVCMYT